MKQPGWCVTPFSAWHREPCESQGARAAKRYVNGNLPGCSQGRRQAQQVLKKMCEIGVGFSFAALSVFRLRRAEAASAVWIPHWHSEPFESQGARAAKRRSEERRVGKECRSRWSPYH